MRYKAVGGVDLFAHVFSPEGETPAGPRPALALFHGGGWVYGGPEEFFGMCRRYAAHRFVAVSFQYRLSRNADGSYPHPHISPIESVKDARSAIRWLVREAPALGIDPARIVVGGQSAGAQLAQAVVLCDDVNEDGETEPLPPIAALLLYGGNYNTVEAWCDRLLGERRGEIWRISPYHRLRPGMPPVAGFHGKDDATVAPYIVEFYQRRMKELGNEFALHWYPGRKHYLGAGCEKYAEYFDERVMDDTDAFLREHGLL